MKKETNQNITKKTGKEKRQAQVSKNKKWELFPLQFVIAVLPLIVYLYMGQSGYSMYAWNSYSDTYADVFLHSKMIVFMVVTVILLVLLGRKLWKMDSAKRKQSLIVFIPLFIYLGFVILSTICSKDIELSLFGSMDQKEPFLVLVGYVALTLYGYLVLDSMEEIKRVVMAAVVGACLMATLGILQMVGKDPLAMESIQRLFTPKGFIDQYGALSVTVAEGGAYGTLFNPNYVGTYVAMYLPLLLIGFLVFKELWKKVVCILCFVGLTVMLFASQSRTGLIAVIAVAVMLLIFLGREVWKRWYLVIPGVTFLVMAFLLIDTYRDNLLTNRLKEMFAIEQSENTLKGIDTIGNGVEVAYKDTVFTVMMPIAKDDFAYVVMENGEEREVTYNEDFSYAYVTLSNGDEIEIKTAVYEDVYSFGLKFDKREYFFTNQVVVGNYKFINEYGRLDECIMPTNVLPGYERIASGRGYVWGRSIPLLLENFVVGSGPDTFAIEFPQNDYVARYSGGFSNTIFTRPHNFYLQMGIQTGTLSLIFFMIFYMTYFVGSCRRYLSRKFTKLEEWIGFALFLCTVGFMASGFANDSLIVVTPVFYVLLGAGMTINHKFCPLEKKVKKNEEEEGTEN